MNENQTIFVTGGASGIGRETALLFARKGWRVAATDVDAPGLERLRAELEPLASGRIYTAHLDVSDAAAYRAALADFGRWSGGRLDLLFNCAGILRMGAFETLSLEEQARTVEVNVLGVLHGIHLAFPLLKATPGAHVVSMGSASGVYGVPELAAYSASKFFIRGLTEALNLEFERHGITVSDLMPLYVDTPMVRDQSYQAGSLRTFGARLSAPEIAALVWRAAHGTKVHWVPGLLMKVLNYLGAALPFVSKPTMRRVCKL